MRTTLRLRVVGREGTLVKREFCVESLVHGPFERYGPTAHDRVFMETATFGFPTTLADQTGGEG